MHTIRITTTGGPDVLNWTQVEDPSPGPGEVVAAVGAAGVNFIDTYQRNGMYPVELPHTLGLEGAGTVIEVGSDVESLQPGDRIAWSDAPGSYAERVVVSAERAVPVPASVDLDVAAAVMLQGMTAHYLAIDTFPLAEGDRCLIHAGAGGVGRLLIQIAKLQGAEVFTTVGSDEKARIAASAGADYVINYREHSFGEAVTEVAGDKPLDVVYDGVGKAVFVESLDLLRPRGMMITFGNASGPVDPLSPLELSRRGSLFLTRPSLFHYVSSRDELLRRANDLFDWIGDRKLDVLVGERLPLAQAAEAHRLLEGRKTVGKVLLVP